MASRYWIVRTTTYTIVLTLADDSTREVKTQGRPNYDDSIMDHAEELAAELHASRWCIKDGNWVLYWGRQVHSH